MWRKNVVSTLALVVVLGPTVGAQWWSLDAAAAVPCGGSEEGADAGTPFGYFNGNPQGVDVNNATGILPVAGWALDNDGVAWVDIMVDGVVIGRASYGLRRPSVSRSFPGMPDSEAPGFGFEIDTTNFLNGEHVIGARVQSLSGERRVLNTLTFQFTNTTHNLRPFGKLDFPQNQAELDGNCDVNDPDRRYAVVTGWALDAGVENNDHGVGYVELLLDGAFFANSRISCAHSTVTGAFSNCYGIRRDDIESRYPSLKDATHAGFRFVMDIGALLNIGYTPGQHFLTIRSGDIDSQVSNIDSIAVHFQCEDFFVNQESFGDISRPRPAGEGSGQYNVSGWALDREGVARVRILIDGRFNGLATYGFTRPEITTLYPGFINSATPGWVYTIDTFTLSDGEHVVTVVVRDKEEVDTVIGEQTFFVNNG